MSDRGLQEAIRAAGGVTELARRIGISQPSVSNWRRVPAERVLSVEEVTGVARDCCVPISTPTIIPARRRRFARAQEYALLGACSTRAPDAELLARSASCAATRRRSALAHIALAEAAKNARVERVEREYFDLFIGLGRGELLPYGSYYLTGFLHERPLARLREDLGAHRHRARRRQSPSRRITPAILCEIMAGLAGGQLAGAGRHRPARSSKSTWRRGSAASSPISSAPKRRDFYRRVGTLGRLFMEIETEAFALPA